MKYIQNGTVLKLCTQKQNCKTSVRHKLVYFQLHLKLTETPYDNVMLVNIRSANGLVPLSNASSIIIKRMSARTPGTNFDEITNEMATFPFC